MFDFALKVFLFIAPIFYWADWPLARAQLQFFQLGTIFLFLLALSQQKQRDLKDKFLLGLGFICFLNIFIAETPYSKIALINIFFALLLYYLIVCYTKNIRCLFRILLALSIANVGLAIFQRFGIDFVYDTSTECCAFMGTSAFHGDLQALVFPIAVYFHPLVALVPITGIILSNSVTAGTATVVGLGFILARKKFGPVYFLALISGAVGFIIYFRDLLLYKVIMRFTIWEKALEITFDKPFRGWGFGSIMGMVKELTWEKYGTADRLYNDYLEFSLCTGAIGVIFLAMFAGNKVKRYSRVQHKSPLLNTIFASCLVASVLCLSHSPMAPLFSTIGHSPRIAVVIIAMFAMLEILLQEGELNVN